MKRLLHIILDEAPDHNAITLKPAEPTGIDIIQDNDRLYLSTLTAARELRDALQELIDHQAEVDPT